MYVHQTPVGAPAPIILVAGLILFGLLVMIKSGGPSDEAGAKRSRLSMLGIAIQFLSFFAVGFGEVTIGYAPTSPESLEQAGVTLLLVAITCGVFAASKHALGRNWSLVARTRADHELVTWGVFAYVRHPIYSALFVWVIAMAVAFGHYWGLILGVPLYWIGTILRVREEERLLRAQFGADYEAYANRVKRFLPGIV
jgi:protein-S-isoprenylcysteine O-methyltransferase Ste14